MAAYHWDWPVLLAPVPSGDGYYWQWLASGLAWTVAISLGAWVLALLLGFAVGVARTLPHRPARWLSAAWVELFRNTPLIVQMFLWFFVVPELLPTAVGDWLKHGLPRPEVCIATLALGLYTSARIAEQVRAGINSLSRGQTQAALALGMSLPQVYALILLPQALRRMLPTLTSELMSVFKNSSVALTLGVLELVAQARQMSDYTFQSFESFIVTTVLFVLLALTAYGFMAWLERRLHLPGQAP